MKKIRKHICAALALCILSGVCAAPCPVSAEDTEDREVLYGDVNEDNNVDVSDVVLLARFCAEDRTADISRYGMYQADVNQDHDTNSEDIILILQYIAKLIPAFPGPNILDIGASYSLTEELEPEEVTGKPADEDFIRSQLQFSANLLRETCKYENNKRMKGEPDKNLMISPLSVSLALSMTANGAKGETQEQMVNALSDTLDLDSLNAYYYDYIKETAGPNSKNVCIANSIWGRDDNSLLKVPDAFLRTTKSYYNADFLLSPFNSFTVNDINNWVSYNTKKMIPELINEINPDDILYLINTLTFEAEWSKQYLDYQVDDDIFRCYDGSKVKASFMKEECYNYLADDKATGFLKYYDGAKYAFAAILPNSDITVYDYINDMTQESLLNLLNGVQHEMIKTALPKFSFDYDTSLKPVLKGMGMELPFDMSSADFTGLNEASTPTYIGDVVHKTKIILNEKGTKAAAATIVMLPASAAPPEKPKEVILDHPFIFMILDRDTNLPLFTGIVADPTK